MITASNPDVGVRTGAHTAVSDCGTASNRSGLLHQSIGDSAAPARPRICLLGADYDNSNLGIRALATGALTAIDAQYPEATVQMLEYGAAPREFAFDLPGKTTCIKMLNIRFSKQLWVRNHIARLIASAFFLKLVPWRRVRNRLASRNPWLQAIVNADYVLSLNYGDSFSDIYGPLRFVYVSLPQILTLLLGKPLVQLPQTIGPFKRRICRVVAKWILSRSVLVYSRDEEGVPAIRKMVPASHASRVRFCYDLGFIVPLKRFTPLDTPLDSIFSQRPVVGLNVSGLLWMGGYTRDNMFGLYADYQTVVRRVIADLIETKGATVLLVPHVNVSRGEGDPVACDRIVSELQSVYPDRIFTMKPPFSEQEIKYVIAQCDFFIGARMHACIAALSQCVPAVAMAYSGKFIGVFRSVGMDSAVIDLRMLSVDQVVAALSSIYQSREVLRSGLERKMPAVKQVTRNLLRDCSFEGGGLAQV